METRATMGSTTTGGFLNLATSANPEAFRIDAGDLTSLTAAGGSVTLPALAEGYVKLKLNGVVNKVAYYG